MKKILIADDSQSNRILLRALIENYCEENAEVITIDEAADGLEASSMAKSNHYNLIFMDIMMPEMNGVEATRTIRSFDSKVMIIAVSAADDLEYQRKILSFGAEDYISKPINADVFTSRLANYFSLVHSRANTKKLFNNDAANIWSTDIFSRKLLFYVQNEDDLSEFWEYYLLGQNEGSEILSTGVRTLFALGSATIKFNIKNQIIVEDSNEYMYMTMTEINRINEKIIELIFKKNNDTVEYKMKGSKLTIRIPIVEQTIPELILPVKTTTEPSSGAIVEPTAVPPYIPTTELLQTYNYMDDEDLEELENFVGKLNSLMLILSSSIEIEEIEEISNYINDISRIASHYNESFAISQSLAELSATIEGNKELFMEISHNMAAVCSAFGADLSSWIRLIFVEGAPNVRYMDDTIIANARMIESMLVDDGGGEDDSSSVDNIFDF